MTAAAIGRGLGELINLSVAIRTNGRPEGTGQHWQSKIGDL
jgi:hypothetical protein